MNTWFSRVHSALDPVCKIFLVVWRSSRSILTDWIPASARTSPTREYGHSLEGTKLSPQNPRGFPEAANDMSIFSQGDKFFGGSISLQSLKSLARTGSAQVGHDFLANS